MQGLPDEFINIALYEISNEEVGIDQIFSDQQKKDVKLDETMENGVKEDTWDIGTTAPKKKAVKSTTNDDNNSWRIESPKP